MQGGWVQYPFVPTRGGAVDHVLDDGAPPVEADQQKKHQEKAQGAPTFVTMTLLPIAKCIVR